MALPTLNWKKIEPYNVGGSAVMATVLDAIYTMFTTSNYHDGTARTPGSGSAWTCNRYQNGATTEALYFTPPSASISDFKVIVAGVDAGAPNPTMEADLFYTGRMMVGINKFGGAFNAWNNALPFTSGTFSGYNNWARPNDGSTKVVNYIWAVESQEGLTIWVEYDDNTARGFIAGALLDPMSDNVVDSESNGRIFSFLTNLSGGHFTPSWPSFFMGDNGNYDFHHFRTWRAGSTVMSSCATMILGNTPSTHFQLPSGRVLLVPAYAYRMASGSTYIGRWREVFIGLSAVGMSTATSGGSDLGHHIRHSTVTSGNTIFFKA